ncbi:uncharacterized protein AAEQ78_021885 isoform 2-T2 [Lycaon pictus]
MSHECMWYNGISPDVIRDKVAKLLCEVRKVTKHLPYCLIICLYYRNHWTTSSKNLSRSSSTFKFLDFLYQELHFEMDLTLSTSSSLSYITPSDQRGIFTGVVMMWETKTKEKIKLAYRLQPIGRKKEIKIRYHGNQKNGRQAQTFD